MKDEVIELRRRSGHRNPDLEINKVAEPYEVFVHHLRVPDHHEVEIHLPLEWVSIGMNEETIFSPEANRILIEAEILVRQY